MNPLENEAVVFSALRMHSRVVSLVDAASGLNGFRAEPGLETWQVPHPSEKRTLYERWDDVPEELRGGQKGLKRSMFGPGSFEEDEQK